MNNNCNHFEIISYLECKWEYNGFKYYILYFLVSRKGSVASTGSKNIFTCFQVYFFKTSRKKFV